LILEETVPNQKPGLIAPLWHTALLVFLYLILPVITLLRSHHADAPQHFHSTEYLSLIYFAGLLVQWGIFGLVYAGLFNRETQFTALIGKHWNHSRDVIRDVALGIGAVVLIFAAALLLSFLLGRLEKPVPEVLPKTAVQFYFFFLLVVSGGYAEEVIFRGYFLKQFTWLFKSETLSVLLQALLFAFGHGLDTLSGFLYKLFVGLLFGSLAIRRKSLLPGIVAHCSLNAIAAIFIFPY
jgi:membrane protease YdiL (CAAX protease family)